MAPLIAAIQDILVGLRQRECLEMGLCDPLPAFQRLAKIRFGRVASHHVLGIEP
jgi:hypothetical protein